MGFEELHHTADWAIRVWADDLPALLVESAQAMNELSGARLAEAPRVTRKLKMEAADVESLLVAFLSELIYLAEQENLGFDQFNLEIFGHSNVKLSAELGGAPLASLTKAIKAITYHNMEIRRTERGYQVEIVFDV